MSDIPYDDVFPGHRQREDEPTLELSPEEMWMEHRGVGYSNTETAQKLRDQAVTLLDLAEQIDPIPMDDKLPELNLRIALRVTVRARNAVVLMRDMVVSQVGEGVYNVMLPAGYYSQSMSVTIERVQ